MKQRTIIGVLIFFLVGILIFILAPKWYIIHPKAAIKASYRKELANLGVKAITSLDVPVGAILVYHDSIIGRGFNTVRKDHIAGGHAEINAISDAINKMGWEGFRAIDHSQLTIYSTFEPCTMCIGAMEEYHIKHAIFIKSKPITQWFGSGLKHIRYEWLKRKSMDDDLQDSLFRAYPGYH
jgi:tRNA(Arg) A34 adenosine deaminase TadA